MSSYVHVQLAPPRSWDQFEELCADIFQAEWQDAALVRHGRAGQSQHGVDIVGRDGAIWPVGIQCKKKSVWPVTKVTTSDLDKEVKKAKFFQPALKALYLVSTAPDDQPLQEHARLISARHAKQGIFSVEVLGWEELVRRATRHGDVAAKHFGSFSAGPASPLLATWRASGGKLLLGEQELAIAIRELIHDLLDYPSGRIVFRQVESEDLLLQVKLLQAGKRQSLEVREAVLELRDKLKVRRDRESAVMSGLRLLLGHRHLRDFVRVVWEDHAPLLIRSYVEQEIDLNVSNVTGLEKIRLFPPGFGDDLPIAVFMPSPDIGAIWHHQFDLKSKYPNLAPDNISELPPNVQFRWAVPAVIRKIVSKIGEGVPLEEMERRRWLEFSAWKFTI